MSIRCPVATHDLLCYALSSLPIIIGGLCYGWLTVGDEAYPAGDRILAPWRGRGLSIEKDAFNYFRSSARIFIEQAFGVLIARWGILWRLLRVGTAKAAKTIRVADEAAQIYN
jgi:DDE superfamily endonuclease